MTPDPNLAIHMQDVGMSRGPVEILRDVNWKVKRGESVTVLGPNGSGKTTIMRVLTGFMWPTRGTVDVLGQRLGQTDMRLLRKRIAVVDPSERYSVDPDLTACKVVLTGLFGTLGLYDEVTDEQTQEAESLLHTVGLGHRINQKYGILSTGEKRRALLARALIHLPELLILDEPTAGLDITGRERVLATIAKLQTMHPEITVVNVTHHVEEISPLTTQVVMLGQGKVVAYGHPDKIITPEILTQIYNCRVYVQKKSGRWWLEVLPEAWLDFNDD